MTDIVALATRRSAVRRQILDCTRCDLRPAARAPVPFRGTAPTRILILGEAPGALEDRTGRPFVGESGKVLEAMMTDVGLPPSQHCLVANACCCRAHGPPTPDQILACSPNLRSQIALADPEWVLVLGSTALKALGCIRSTITQARGSAFDIPAGPAIGRRAFATWHPAAGLRSPHRLNELRGDLSTFAQVLAGDAGLAQAVTVRVWGGGRLG